MSPQISVYLPTRNRAELLARAVASVLHQTWTSLELIIVDDGSTDRTATLMTELAARDDRIKILRHDHPKGAPAARNAAIAIASGELITGLDDDDEMEPDHLQQLHAAFLPTYSLVSTSSRIVANDFHRIENKGHQLISLDDILYRNIVGTQALTLTSRLQALGGFDPTLCSGQDYDLWIRLIQTYGPALRLAKPTYVVHTGHNFARISDDSAMGTEQLIDKHRSLLSASHLRRRQLERMIRANERLDFSTARRLCDRRSTPSVLRYWVTSHFPSLRKLAHLARSIRSRFF
jgi:glycosyltransferase involved in cell wall biosynthesis